MLHAFVRNNEKAVEVLMSYLSFYMNILGHRMRKYGFGEYGLDRTH